LFEEALQKVVNRD